METVVAQELEMKLVLSPERSIAVPARLSYDVQDPYAVHITFHLDSEAPVTWVFARELLAQGARRPSGRGDVRVSPAARSGEGRALQLALHSPAGQALLEVPAAKVEAWLKRTYRLVPLGRESDSLDLDGELAELLA
jgi:Streptomyces sporulation and cell division protein, SsgA.